MALLQLVAGRRRDDDLDPGQLADDRQRAGDVVAVADVGEAQPVELAEALAQGHQVGQRLAGVVQRRQRVDDRDLGRGGQLGDRLVGAGADHDRVDVAREHPRRVADRLAAGELHLVAAQDDRGRAQLGDPDLEGDPRPRRGPLEDQRDAAPGQRVGADALAAAGFQLQRPLEQLAELERAELFAGEEIPLQAADTTARGADGARLEPLPRAGFPARPGAAQLALAAAALRRAQRDPRPGQPRPHDRVRDPARRQRLGRRPAAGVPAALRRAAGPGLRRRGAPGADLAQRARRRCGRCWRARTRT